MSRISIILLGFILIGACSPRQPFVEASDTREYEQMEYLSDNLAIGISGGTIYLLTADGTVIAAGEDIESLRVNAQAFYARYIDEEYAGWDIVLNQYDSLCNACLARRPVGELLERLNNVGASLQRAVGRMDAQQLARFEAIRERYGRHRR